MHNELVEEAVPLANVEVKEAAQVVDSHRVVLVHLRRDHRLDAQSAATERAEPIVGPRGT